LLSGEAVLIGPGKVWGVMRKAPKGGPLHPLDKRANRMIAMVRARVEHPFRIIKRQFDHIKTRYRGLAKNATRASPGTTRSSSRWSRSATCSWCEGG
jgi:hypothetical protein